MKNILVFIFLFTISLSSFSQTKSSKILYQDNDWCKEPIDSLPISDMIKSMGYYWKLDSLGTNYMRRMFTTRFYDKKLKFNVDYDFVLKYFGLPNRESSNSEILTLTYSVFDTRLIKDDFWSDSGMKLYIHFRFDSKNKQLVLIERS